MIVKEFVVNNLLEMEQFAGKIALLCSSNEIITLRGDLGAGKTSFSQSFIKYLIPEVKTIVSPTFLLMQSYHNEKLNIHHFDLYRLKNIEEVIEIGLEDSLENTIAIIEWPEIIENILPIDRIDLFITFMEEENSRKITAHCYGNWEYKLNE